MRRPFLSVPTFNALMCGFGASGVVAVYGVGCLLACAIIAVSGVVAAWLAALIVGVALLAAAGGAALLGRGRMRKADIEEIKERTHR